MGFIKDIIVNVKRFVNKKTLKDANLDPHNVRNYLTDRDSAFIYACRKFNIKQEQFFFTKEAIEKYYTGKDNKYSLIKVNFDLHTTYNHLYIFVFLMLKELNLSTYPVIKSLLSLFIGKGVEVWDKLESAVRVALESQQYWDCSYKDMRSIWSRVKICFMFSVCSGIYISFRILESELNYIFVKCSREKIIWEEHWKEKCKHWQTHTNSSEYKEEGLYLEEFKVLGIQPTKDKTLIKKAYRKMVIIYHPDKAGDNKMIRKINEAYETLMRL